MANARSIVHVPEEWAIEESRKVGPFVTRVKFRLPDGSHRTWNSRRHRKLGRIEEQRPTRSRSWWEPRELSWWIAVLFMVGSFLFALGALPLYSDHIDVRIDSATYFVGSLFFTTAGYLQFVQTINTHDDLDVDLRAHREMRLLAWQPHRIDWWSASVQSVGTLLFNISTSNAMDAAFSLQQQERLVWAPDMFGSVAFMIASTLAWLEVSHGWWSWRPRDIPWRIVALNLAGSTAFLSDRGVHPAHER